MYRRQRARLPMVVGRDLRQWVKSRPGTPVSSKLAAASQRTSRNGVRIESLCETESVRVKLGGHPELAEPQSEALVGWLPACVI